jgi:hypothetical protein
MRRAGANHLPVLESPAGSSVRTVVLASSMDVVKRPFVYAWYAAA